MILDLPGLLEDGLELRLGALLAAETMPAYLVKKEQSSARSTTVKGDAPEDVP
jgi:hypothetical protein